VNLRIVWCKVLTANEKEEKKGLGITELVAIVGLMVSILVAGTTLLSRTGYVPEWWFHSSLILLILLAFSVPCMIFAKPISKKVNKLKLERKQNAIAQKHFAEFKDLVWDARTFTLGIFSVLDRLRGQFEPEIKEKTGLLPIYLMQTYNRNDVESPWDTLRYSLEGFDGTLRDLTLLADRFDLILGICKKNIALTSIFAREIKKEHKIPDHIEKEFEGFREKYNDFMKDCVKYFHKLNQELGERIIPEHFDYVEKW